MGKKVIRGGLKLIGGLISGSGDNLLTVDPTTGEVGSISGTPLTTTLTSGQIIVGNASNVATATAVTGDVLISNTGVTSISPGVIVNADVNASAAIALTKLAPSTASRVAVYDGSGFLSASATTATQVGYLSTTTSDVQTQLNAKQATITGGATTITSSDLTTNRALISNASGKVAVSSVTSTEVGYLTGVSSPIQTQIDGKLSVTFGVQANGDILYRSGGVWTNLAVGSSGQVLTVNAGLPSWQNGTSNGLPTGGAVNQYLRKDSGTDYDVVWDDLTLSKLTDITANSNDVNLLAGADAFGVTNSNILYLSGVSSNIQTQIDGKQSRSLAQNAIWVGDAGNLASQVPGGSDGQVLTSVSGVPQWQDPTPPGNVSGVAPSVDNAITRWNGTAADSIQNSGLILGDDNFITFPTATGLNAGTTNGNTLLLRGYNTGGASYTTMATITSGATPTLDFITSATIGSAYIYRVGGTDVSLADGGTGASLADPGYNGIFVWDDTLNQTRIAALSGITYDSGTNTLTSSGGGGGGTPGGANTQVQFNDSGSFGGDSAFTWNKTDDILTTPRVQYTAQASAPVATVTNGDLYYNSTNLDFQGRINGQWINITRPAQSTQSGTTYTVAESDRNTIIDFTSASTVAVTLANLSTGTVITLSKGGTGNISLVADVGLTLEGVATTIETQYTAVTVVKKSATVWRAYGSLGSSIVPLSQGGTGTALADPGADRIFFWDDSAGNTDWLSTGSTLAITGTTLNVATNGITDSQIRQSGALSVIGNSTNATANVGDISAATNHNILRRNGTTLGFGSIDLSQSGAVGTSILPIANGGTGNATIAGNTYFGNPTGSVGAPDFTAAAALTKVDDTNVTLTLGGSPTTALLTAASLTLGWTGQLSVARGGTGASTLTGVLVGNGTSAVTATAIAQGDLFYGSAAGTLSALAKNTSSTRYLSNTGTSNNPAWAQIDLTNGVTGVLPIANGGTGSSSFTGYLLASGGTATGANTFTGTTSNIFKYVFDNLGTTQTNGAGHWLANTTAAAAGSQQQSPSTVWEGQGWKTDATAGSQSVKFSVDVLPVQGAANPTGTWRLRQSVNAGAYANVLTIGTNGITTLTSSASGTAVTFQTGASSYVRLNETGSIFYGTGPARIGSSTNGTATYSISGGSLTYTADVTHYFTASSALSITAGNGTQYQYSGTVSATSGTSFTGKFSRLVPTYNIATSTGMAVYDFVIEPTETNLSGTTHYGIVNSSTTALNGIGTLTPTAVWDIGASTTSRASLRIRSGTAPSSPNDGDIWFDGSDLLVRIGGVTRTIQVI